jgi:cytochrome P450
VSLETLFDAEQRRDPYPAYRAWREAAPVARPHEQLFVLSGHAACTAVLRDPRFGHSEPGEAGQFGQGRAVAPDDPLVDEQGRPVRSFLVMNPPDHTRLRRLVSRAFTRPMVARLEPRIEEITARLLADARARGGPVDVIESLAYPLPVAVISELLGVPEEDRARFVGWSHALARALDPEFLIPPEQRGLQHASRAEFAEYIRGLAAQRRARPGEDLISALVGVRDSGDGLTENELIATCILLLIAGHETTGNLIGNGTLALLRHPAQLARLRAEPALLDRAVEELLRYDSPVQLTGRVALADAEVDGVAVPRGAMTLLLIGAANRDPAAYDRPEELDITREPTRHLAFGQGLHFCLGAPLARLEARIALRALLDGGGDGGDGPAPAGEPGWKDNIVLRGLSRLPVTLG